MENPCIISADSHVTEPANLWIDRMDKKYRDHVPKVIENPNGSGHLFVAPGLNPVPASGVFATGRSGQELKEHLTKGYDTAPPGGWDPVERIKDQDIDGVEAEVLYPSLGMALFLMEDANLQRACFRAYNDWIVDFCSYNPKRLHAAALISLEDVSEGVNDLECYAKLGLKSAMIWCSPPAEKPYSSKVYDPFWQVAQDLQIPVSLHSFTGRGKESREVGFNQRITTQYMILVHEVQRCLADLIFGGVLERFPRLMVVSVENDIGWLPHYIYRLDHAYGKFGALQPELPPMKPSEYARRQLWATFQDDPVGCSTYKFFNNYMWASDFPHSDTTWPHSRKIIERDFAGLPVEVTRKIIFENAAKLYGITPRE